MCAKLARRSCLLSERSMPIHGRKCRPARLSCPSASGYCVCRPACCSVLAAACLLSQLPSRLRACLDLIRTGQWKRMYCLQGSLRPQRSSRWRGLVGKHSDSPACSPDRPSVHHPNGGVPAKPMSSAQPFTGECKTQRSGLAPRP